MYLQSEAYSLLQPEAKIEKVAPENPVLSPEEREQNLVNLGAIALLFCIGAIGGFAAWIFLPIG